MVGRSYPPEFYSWIKIPHVRKLFEQIAQETEEDYQAVIHKLEEFGVKIVRPKLSDQTLFNNQHIPPPMAPRDSMVMIGETFNTTAQPWNIFYQHIKDPLWPDVDSIDQLESWQQTECREIYNWDFVYNSQIYPYEDIINHIQAQGNTVKSRYNNHFINGASVARIGKDLFFGTETYNDDLVTIKKVVDTEFSEYRNHIVNTGGHSDGTYCPVCPGLIISLNDVPTYADTFPGWEVVYLPGQSWEKVKPFLNLRHHNKGKWWIPGFEQDQAVIDTVETWLSNWVGYVEETVFDVNMLIIDPKNVMVFNYNKQVFDALDRYGITAHVVPFRHIYFWDGGIHCITLDLNRVGKKQDFFPNDIEH
jgi:glycine amidinotransferase